MKHRTFSLGGKSAGTNVSTEKLEAAVRALLGELGTNATACPGQIANQLGVQLRALSPAIIALCQRKEVVAFQRGHVVNLANTEGAVRIALVSKLTKPTS